MEYCLFYYFLLSLAVHAVPHTDWNSYQLQWEFHIKWEDSCKNCLAYEMEGCGVNNLSTYYQHCSVPLNNSEAY